MESLPLTKAPVTQTGMLIRKPALEVFEAFVDPAITTKFWFTHGSGRLALGETVEWKWEMYGVSATARVTVFEPGQRLVIEWPGYSGLTTVEWRFEAQPDGTTFVRLSESGFTGTGDELVQQVTDSTGGFTLVLAGLKAWLEHGIQLNLVGDRFPKGD
jgi:uncharacterized protein YndB with AHSA1/START domain